MNTTLTTASPEDTATSPPLPETLAPVHVAQGGSEEHDGEGQSSPAPHFSLDRYPGETPRAFAAFTAFFTLGHQRSLQAVADKLDISLDTIKKWSSRHDWQARVAQLDAPLHHAAAGLYVAAEKRAAADWAHRLQSFREQEWDAAQKLLSAARCYLEAFGDDDLSRMTLAQVSRALRISSQIARLALTGLESPSPAPEPAHSPIQQQLLNSLARLSAHREFTSTVSAAQQRPDESKNPQLSQP